MRASTDHPVHDLIAARWSPCSFADRDVSMDDLRCLFEAARWAPSSYNEQPWRYLVALKEVTQEFQRMLSCLVEANQLWAGNAPVLALGVVKLNLTRNDKPNRAALHDLGLATANLVLEATARGLVVHQMIGIVPERARELYGIPPGYEALTGLAIGYVGPPERLPEEMRSRDRQRRPRQAISTFVFAGTWGAPAPLVS